MKIEQREERRPYDVYVAADGTEFRDRAECELYEKTARCVIRAKLNIKEVDHWELCLGMEDSPVEVCNGKIEDLLMYVSLYRTTYNRLTFDNFIQKVRPKKAKNMLLFLNCDREPYYICWEEDLHKRIETACNKTEE